MVSSVALKLVLIVVFLWLFVDGKNSLQIGLAEGKLKRFLKSRDLNAMT